jgi:hypothetical protein
MHVARGLRAATLVLIGAAALWDTVGLLAVRPPWWPPLSYGLAGAAILTGCVAVLVTLFTTRRVPRAAPGAPPTAAPPHTGSQLIAIGILLAAWLLRGHAEIPPDAPLIAAEVFAAALYAVITRRRS